MGNSLGGKKSVKVMKITGETLKLKTPVKAGEVLKDYPGLVLLESESVKHYGARAKPLEADQNLVAKRLYFLVELPPKASTEKPRRVRSGINMSAKDRLENLMLARRSSSDLSMIMKPSSSRSVSIVSSDDEGSQNGGMRVKMRLPKAQVEELMRESKDEGEAAAKIMSLCMAADNNNNNNNKGKRSMQYWNTSASQTTTSAKKRVSFVPVSEGEMQIAVASY